MRATLLLLTRPMLDYRVPRRPDCPGRADPLAAPPVQCRNHTDSATRDAGAERSSRLVRSTQPGYSRNGCAGLSRAP